MNREIRLISDSYHVIKTKLSKDYASYTGKEPYEVVYQNVHYHFEVKLDIEIEEIDQLQMWINQVEMEIDYKYAEDKILITTDRAVFYMIYGITNIQLEIFLANGEKLYLSSGFLAVAVEKKYQATMVSIQGMLDEIYRKEHALLYKQKTSNIGDILSKTLSKGNDKYDTQIDMLKYIVKTYRDNLPYFMQHTNYTSRQGQAIDAIDKLKAINNKNIDFMIRHPEYLKLTEGYSGLVINRKSYIPEKSLVDTKEYSYGTYENIMILSFLKELITSIHDLQSQLKEMTSNNYPIDQERQVIKEEYILSTVIIQQYLQMTFKDYQEELTEIARQMTELFVQYKNILKCPIEKMKKSPRPTPVFLELLHYRNIFTTMASWFNMSILELPKENILVHFSSADLIYEYYCLVHIFEILVALNFKEAKEKRRCYRYPMINRESNLDEMENTFYFYRDDMEITLYYQPIIYSDQVANDINLFRTDGSFYAPDFVLKKRYQGNESYGILDAKWRNRNVLMKRNIEGGLSDLVYKYFYSVVDKENLESVPFFWLIQGKDDFYKQKIYYHHAGKMSKMMSSKFRSATGIVQLTPDYGNQDLLKIIDSFIKG